MKIYKIIILLFSIFILFKNIQYIYPDNWPQLQHDKERTGKTQDSIAPPFRFRWIWFGPEGTIRNHLSNPAWSGPDIYPGEIISQKITLPSSVPFCIGSGVQPIVAEGKVFTADINGNVYAINADDGTTLWTASNPGGTVVTPCYSNGTVVVSGVQCAVRAYNAVNGTKIWEYNTDGAITTSPVSDGNVVVVGCHDGHVYCLSLTGGNLLWKSENLGAQIVGECAMDSDNIYIGSENMFFHAISITDGSIKKKIKVQGQSFYTQWPVIYSSYVFVETGPIPAIGSEYVGEDVMELATDIEDEQNRWIEFLSGAGPYRDASIDWKHLTVLNRDNFIEPFIVPVAPFEGCGTPPEPPVIDSLGRVLTYFKTKFPKIAKNGAFGTNYSIDISAIDLNTGRRIVIDNGKQATGTYTWETDNCYGICTGGEYMYFSQDFRGTLCWHLPTSSATLVLAHYSAQDGGGFPADVLYCGNIDEPGPRLPTSTGNPTRGRVSPAISGNILYVRERFGIIAIEHHQ